MTAVIAGMPDTLPVCLNEKHIRVVDAVATKERGDGDVADGKTIGLGATFPHQEQLQLCQCLCLGLNGAFSSTEFLQD